MKELLILIRLPQIEIHQMLFIQLKLLFNFLLFLIPPTLFFLLKLLILMTILFLETPAFHLIFLAFLAPEPMTSNL
jgi:hypothetical protein